MAQKVGRTNRMDRKEGQSVGGLSLGNPGEERRLAATLSKIEREKRKRESAMSWNQRSFFMKQVFDQDNELRFVKAAQRPKYLNCIPPPPREGDNSWMKDEYVFSFKPKTSKSPETKDLLRKKNEEVPLEESPKALGVDEGASTDQPPQDEYVESKLEDKAAATESEEAEHQKRELEKRELASRGGFGARREQMKMPLLMSGAWKQKTEPELKPEEVVEEKPNDSESTPETDVGENKDTIEDADSLNQSKSNSTGSPEVVKPKTRFPVLKVRALGLFAMTFKKSALVPPLQTQPQLQSPSTNELKLSPIQNPEKEVSLVTSSFPPKTASPTTEKARSPLLAVTAAASELERPGSVSLPNSPVIHRKPQLVRQQSDHSVLVKSVERPKTDRPKRAVHNNESGHNRSRRSSRRDGTAKSNHERSKRHSESSVKPIKSASAAMPKNKRDSMAKTNLSSSVPDGLGRDSKHIWGAKCENENQEKEQKDDNHGDVDGKVDEDVEYHVIRRIVRTLPAHLMLKTSKREVEAGGDVALLRQKMMDLARADTTRRASLDPRFKKLEKSLCNHSPHD